MALHLKQKCVTPERYQKIADPLLDSAVRAAWRMEYPFADKRQGHERFGEFFCPIYSLQDCRIIPYRQKVNAAARGRRLQVPDKGTRPVEVGLPELNRKDVMLLKKSDPDPIFLE